MTQNSTPAPGDTIRCPGFACGVKTKLRRDGRIAAHSSGIGCRAAGRTYTEVATETAARQSAITARRGF